MRIVVADYSGHPLQVQLSRALAKRRHQVLHLYFAEFQTPKGRLDANSDDPEDFQCEAISLGRPFAKYKFFRRVWQEIEVGKKFLQRIVAFSPDVVIASNLPLDSLAQIVRGRKNCQYRLVFWQQDIYSVAIGGILSRWLGVVGNCIGLYYRSVERRALKNSDAVVAISRDFILPLENNFGVPRAKLSVIENWAPLNEITARSKVNDWSLRHDLADKDVVLYTGTLGMKHDPAQILAVAEAVRERPRTVVVVVSEGTAADWLKQQTLARRLNNLRVLPFQPYDDYPNVMGSADVLIAVLEAHAGSYSVPSKILSYLCAGRAIVLSAPAANLAYATITNAEAGICTPAGDVDAFVTAVTQLLDDRERRSVAAANGRRYAEQKFNIEHITDQFELVMQSCGGEQVFLPGSANLVADVAKAPKEESASIT